MTGFDKRDAGRRVKLISHTDPHTELKPGALGTYVMRNILSDGKHQHDIAWDDGSRLMLIEGVDKFEFLREKNAEQNAGCH